MSTIKRKEKSGTGGSQVRGKRETHKHDIRPRPPILSKISGHAELPMKNHSNKSNECIWKLRQETKGRRARAAESSSRELDDEN